MPRLSSRVKAFNNRWSSKRLTTLMSISMNHKRNWMTISWEWIWLMRLTLLKLGAILRICTRDTTTCSWEALIPSTHLMQTRKGMPTNTWITLSFWTTLRRKTLTVSIRLNVLRNPTFWRKARRARNRRSPCRLCRWRWWLEILTLAMETQLWTSLRLKCLKIKATS